MSSGCGDVLSLADLQTAKKHQIFEAEVITGKQGGVSGGVDIDYATNPVTGQIQKTTPAVLRDVGFAPASFDFGSGGTLTINDRNKSVLWSSSSGGDDQYYTWQGVLPKVIPASSSPGASGGVAPGAWVQVSYLALKTDLASVLGASMIGLPAGGSLDMALKYTTPEQFLASATDMTEAIQMAFNYGDVVDLSGANYTIARTINIPDGRVLRMQGSNITAATGAAPVFSFSGKNLGLTIIGGSGVVTGSASAFLYCEGGSDTPANADYVKQVRIYGVNVSSATFERAVFFNKAVRQVFIDSCMFYTRNGIESTGKCVEVMINKSIIYGATPDADTFGVKLSSTGGTNFYNEGWHLTDCTVDNFANSIDIADVFVFTFKNGYVACNATTAFAVTVRGVTTTTHCREINFDGVIGGKVRFLDSASGSLTMHTLITGEITNCKPGTCIAIGANLAGIDIRNIKITSSPSCTLASVANNSGNIHFAGVSTDSTLTAGIIFNGTNGGNCSISDFIYAGSGEALSLARAVRLSNVPVVGATTPIWSVRYGYQSTTTTVTIGDYISSTQFTAAKGSKLLFNINMSYTGAAGANGQSIGINVPANVSLPNGAQSMTLILPAASGTVGLTLVCTVTDDFINNLFSVANNTGNTLSILPGAHVSVSLCN